MSRRLSALLALAFAVAIATPAQATPINGSFDSGAFAPWTTAGQTSVIGALGPVAPNDGPFQALLSTGGSSVSDAVLAAFFGIPAGAIDALVGSAIAGSGIQQTFGVIAGEIYTFAYNFLTNEGTPSVFNDTAFAVLNGQLFLLANTNSAFSGAAGTGFNEQTGWGTFAFIAPITGNLTLGFGVVDVLDSVVDSALLVDASVPEPATLGLLGVGLLALRRKILRRNRE